jgi:hypothetical protein
MTYELANKLKDNGYPQGNDTYVDVDGTQWIYTNVLTTIDKAYAPSLSELIEACGSDFNILQRSGDRWLAAGDPLVYDSTPEEAVAKLWLALHK